MAIKNNVAEKNIDYSSKIKIGISQALLDLFKVRIIFENIFALGIQNHDLNSEKYKRCAKNINDVLNEFEPEIQEMVSKGLLVKRELASNDAKKES